MLLYFVQKGKFALKKELERAENEFNSKKREPELTNEQLNRFSYV